MATIYLFRKVNEFTLDRPRSNCLFWSVDHAVIPCCWPIGRLEDSSRAPACTLEAVVSSLSSTPMSDLSKVHSCSGFAKFERRKSTTLVSKREISSFSIFCVSVCDTPDPDPVSIAGDRGGVPGSSDSVSTAARRGDGSHCDDRLFFPARFSPITSSGCTEVSGAGCRTGRG